MKARTGARIGAAVLVLLGGVLAFSGSWAASHATYSYFLPPVGDGPATQHSYLSESVLAGGALLAIAGLAFITQAILLWLERRNWWFLGLGGCALVAGTVLLGEPQPVF